MIAPLPPYPAAIIKTQKTSAIVIADLHIGWEIALAQKGIHVPSQTPKILAKLTSLISTYKPEKLFILGDIKHTVATAEIGEWRDVPDFFNELRRQVQEICVVRGNHDGNLEPLLPENIELAPAAGTIFGEVGLFHGHQWPTPALLQCRTLIMGHVHPVVAFRDPGGFRITRQVWIKAACNGAQLARVLLQKHRIKIGKTPEETLRKYYKIKPLTTQLFIIPPFNDFLGGKPLNEKNLRDTRKQMIVGPVLRSETVDLENAETYLLDGTFLGTIAQLRRLD